MKFNKLKAGALVAGIAAFTLLSGPAAQATGTTGTIPDSSGTEWDPACILHTGLNAPGAASPGASQCEVTTYDGSEEAVDLQSASLASNASGQLVATFTVDQAIPPAGSSLGAVDLPATNYVGGTYFLMFQNKSTQTNVPTNTAFGGGCTKVGTGTPTFDQQASWKDGYHHFVSFHFGYDGTRWTHSAGVGTYEPDGGFATDELGVNQGTGFSTDDPQMPFGTAWNVSVSGNTVTVTVNGKVKESDNTCVGGAFTTVYAAPGNIIANVKAITTADAVFNLPVTVPLSVTCGLTGGAVCESDINGIGGFVFYADQTSGTSTAGLLGCNSVGTSFTRACQGDLSSYMLDQDTIGDGPTCPTPTVGGLLPQNPLFTPDQACQIDDDAVARGTLLAEFWETGFGFVM